MRYIRIMHFLFVSSLALIDLVLTSFFSHLFPSSFFFISNLAFLGIVLLIQNDSTQETMIKAGLLSLWLDLNHLNSFPIFFVAYLLSAAIMRLWERQINSSYLEFSIIALVSIFIKESIQYLLMTQGLKMILSYQAFLAYRIMPTLLLNVALVYPLLVFYKKIHHIILKQTQN